MSLIKWKNLPVEDSTWEDECFIQKHTKLGITLFLKERGMLGPYNTSLAPILLLLFPIEAHYCYCWALTLLLLCRP